MKYILAILLLGSTAQAEEFHFTYRYGRDVLQYKTKAKDWSEAHDRGAQFCYDFFTEKEKPLSEDKGLSIIDVCANPR